jgi:two-component system, OmpR family, sensor kinase
VPAMHRTGSRIGQSPVRTFVPESPPLPIAPTIGLLLGSLLCATLLARYVSKPIHDLRIAFDNAARGDLSLRVGSRMTKRTDELANLGRDFDRMATQLQALLDHQRRLLHHVSHELRSPLARLQIAAGLARYHPDTVATSLDRIDRECARLDTLVGEILTLSKFEAGVVEPLHEQVDLTKLVTDIVMDARFEAHSANHTIVLVNDHRVVVMGRVALLHRAIENVIRNAVKHSPVGSSIYVSVEIADATDESCVRITVDDSGNGIPEAELSSIFLPFSRGAASAPVQGHGLGLTIAKHVVEAHGGRIRVMNLPTRGLRVEIELPAS